MKQRSWLFLALGICVAIFSTIGLWLAPAISQNRSESLPSLQAQYRQAVQAAAIVEAPKVVNNLVAITPENSQLVWNEDKSKLLVLTWKSQSTYTNFMAPVTNTSKDENRVIWVTAAPQMKEFCQNYLKQNPNATEADLKLRIKQYLGLSPDWDYDVFVEMWVSPQDIFRPCVDPEITDQQCNVDFDKVTPQVKGITPDAAIQDYSLFYRNLYYKSIRQGLQPWTGLGYTYDWSDPSQPVGASEFILMPGTAYTIKGAVPTMEYCQISQS